jgi:hypothetical protein
VGFVQTILKEADGFSLKTLDGNIHERSAYKEWWSYTSYEVGRGTDSFRTRDEDGLNKVWRTILCGLALNHDGRCRKFCPTDQGTAYWLDQFVNWMKNGSRMDALLSHFLTAATQGRCYFTALSLRGDARGLCYPTTKPGDEIWVIEGSQTPLILRKAPLSDGEIAALKPKDSWELDDDSEYKLKAEYAPGPIPFGYYELVGDCYLDDYMDGEAMRDESLEDKCIVLV